MKHIKTFENNNNNNNNNNKIYIARDVQKTVDDKNNDEVKYFAFNDIESRSNFLVNYIHNMYKDLYDEDYYEDIKDKFTVDELLKEFNIEESYIELETIDIQENVKMDRNLELNKNTQKYNL